eukprot:6073053-Pleurochrysis_carterae.AAC.1
MQTAQHEYPPSTHRVPTEYQESFNNRTQHGTYSRHQAPIRDLRHQFETPDPKARTPCQSTQASHFSKPIATRTLGSGRRGRRHNATEARDTAGRHRSTRTPFVNPASLGSAPPQLSRNTQIVWVKSYEYR